MRFSSDRLFRKSRDVRSIRSTPNDQRKNPAAAPETATVARDPGDPMRALAVRSLVMMLLRTVALAVPCEVYA
jgi:hypothetical protein